jgi:hypothetical protein
MQRRTGSNVGCVAAAAFVGMAAMMGGCSYRSLNTVTSPGAGVELDTISPWESRGHAPWGAAGLSGSPSVTSASRENWGRTVVLVPAGGVNHQPTYTRDAPHLTFQTARQRDEFPGPEHALDAPDARSGQRQVLEAIEAPFMAALDLVLFVPRAIVTPPWKTVESPLDAYARAPIGEGGLAPSPPPPGPGVEPATPVTTDPAGWPRRPRKK